MSETFDSFESDDAGSAAGLLTGARDFFSFVGRGFDFLRLDTAAHNLRRYRSGKGGVELYPDDEIERHPAMLDAEDENRSEFERRTFTGRTGNAALNKSLLGLPDGETYTFRDHWESGSRWSRPSTYFAFGQNVVLSNGFFDAERNGDTLRIRGTVVHGFGPEEVFDFNSGQPGHRKAVVLERAGEAAPFRMAYDRHQDVEAELRYEPNGRLTLMRSSWGAIK